MSAHLSFDIQLEIMKRLPVKSLIQFRSVCKAWKSSIDSSKFIAGYNVGHDQPQHLMIKCEVGDWEVKYVCFVDDDDTFLQQKFTPTVPPILQLLDESRILDSSHGVLGFYGYFQEPDSSTTKDMVVLWNPTIRKSVGVVVPNVVHWPFRSVVGFGVCPHTNDPKLVKITYICDPMKMESISCIPCCQVMVFTLSSGEWRCLSSNQQLPRKSIAFTWSQAVIGQFIYWLAYDWINVDGRRRNLIMSFDLSTHEFREVQLPDSLGDVPGIYLSVSRLRGSLVLLGYKRNNINCDVWMMEHCDPKAFTKLFTINAPVLLTLGFRMNGAPIVLMDTYIHEYFKPRLYPYALVVYEPCSQHIMDLWIRGHAYSLYGSSYTESLLLLDHDDGHIVRCGAVKKT